MLQREATRFLDIVASCDRVNLVVSLDHSDSSRNDALHDDTKRSAIEQLTELQTALSGMQVKATLTAIERTIRELTARKMTFAQLGEANGDIFLRLKDELAGRQFLFLADSEALLFEPVGPLFGTVVEQAFPAAAEDISEAGKCAGLGRYTASVFHLMRAMECAVQLLAQELGMANVEKVWGNLLSDLNSAIEAMPRGASRDAWSESHSHLYHVKQAWRNRTMHPKKTYTAEESDAVFAAVRSFMRHLATLIPTIADAQQQHSVETQAQ